MIVTIDGPAGSGKSSVARKLAKKLDFQFLDTGAMYLAVTYAVIQKGCDFEDATSIVSLATAAKIRMTDGKVFLNGTDISQEIRTPEVTARIRHIADLHPVRQILSALQREFASSTDCVTEGRDQGTEVFPHAEIKIFLTASPEERARRRHHQLAERGTHIPIDHILNEQNLRDAEDQARTVGRLVAADDAVTVCSDGMSEDGVVAEIEAYVRRHMNK